MCVYVIRFRVFHEPFLLNSCMMSFLVWSIIFPCKKQKNCFEEPRTWVNQNVSLERSQCNKLKKISYLLILTCVFMKGNVGVKLKMTMGKIKANCISCVLRLIWKKLYQLLGNSLLLFNGCLSPKFCLFILQFPYFALLGFEIIQVLCHFTIMFQGEKWLYLLWFKTAPSFVRLKWSPLL